MILLIADLTAKEKSGGEVEVNWLEM